MPSWENNLLEPGVRKQSARIQSQENNVSEVERKKPVRSRCKETTYQTTESRKHVRSRSQENRLFRSRSQDNFLQVGVKNQPRQKLESEQLLINRSEKPTSSEAGVNKISCQLPESGKQLSEDGIKETMLESEVRKTLYFI
jgi:hypothetical protein